MSAYPINFVNGQHVPVDVIIEKRPEPGTFFSTWIVNPIWGGVDRANVGGIGTGREVDAQRLRAAMLAGAVHTDSSIKTDVKGQTYVCARSRVMSKYLDTDLTALGY